MPSIMAKPAMARRETVSSWGMPGRRKAFTRACPRLSWERARALTSAVRVSGSQSSTIREAVSESPAATKKGRCQPRDSRRKCPKALPLRTPARAGPRTKPRPKAAPIMPITLERSSGSELSAMAAWATEMFPPVMPSRIRAASIHSKRLVRASIR